MYDECTVSDFLEAMLLLLPPDAGGRLTPVAPREGSYQPFVRVNDQVRRARIIEGPPLLAPGDEARVMVEIDSGVELAAGNEIPLLEHGDQYVGVLTVVRVCRGATVA